MRKNWVFYSQTNDFLDWRFKRLSNDYIFFTNFLLINQLFLQSTKILTKDSKTIKKNYRFLCSIFFLFSNVVIKFCKKLLVGFEHPTVRLSGADSITSLFWESSSLLYRPRPAFSRWKATDFRRSSVGTLTVFNITFWIFSKNYPIKSDSKVSMGRSGWAC